MPPERRAHQRIPIPKRYSADIRTLARIVLGVAVLTDVSRVGFSALTTRDYATGEELQLELLLSGRTTMKLTFTVFWSQESESGWQIGGSFKHELTEEEVARLVHGR